MFQRTVIAGLGLMGTSLALAMHSKQLSQRFFGVDNNEEYAKKALAAQVVDRLLNPNDQLQDADFLVLCTPVGAFKGILKQLPKNMPAHCLIMDIASVKVAAIKEVLDNVPEYLRSRYVPCHPIAGAASYGPDAADAQLYENVSIIITPHPDCSEEALDRAKAFWKKMGAVTRVLTPEKHDRVYAYVSHLPQLLAYAFLFSYQGEFRRDGLDKFLRIGGSNPHLWQGVFMLNREYLLLALEEFQMEMRHFPQFSAYGQMQAALAAITNDEYKSFAGPGLRDFMSNLPTQVEKDLPENPLPLHHTIATFHNILHMGDAERLGNMLRKAKAIHNQCFM